MASRRSLAAKTARFGLVVGPLLLANACSGDSSVEFDPVGGGTGSMAEAGASEAGSTASAGSGSGGTSAAGGGHAGTMSQAGTDSGGSAGADAAGGSATGGVNGGNAQGGKAGTGGNAQGGKAGMGGSGGSDGGKAGSDNGGQGGLANGGKGGQAGAGGTSGAAGNTGCVSTEEICDGLDNDCDEAIDDDACPTGCVGALFGGHRYLFCGLVDSAAAAAKLCEEAAMALPVIESGEENAFLSGTIKGSTWLGGSDAEEEGDWYWPDQTQFAANKKPIAGVYSNWLAMQPNNNGPMGADENCLVLMPASGMPATAGKWNDLSCDLASLRAACEAPLAP